MNGGDQLARGEKSAQFPASDGKITQEKWNAAFSDAPVYIPVQPSFEWPLENSDLEPHNNS